MSGDARATALPLVVLAGPTGVGKSVLALRLAERFSAEIVSVDSAQVYRGLDIGTDKPGASERARVPHHLLDLRDPSEDYSAGQFVADARAAVASIRARGRLPLLVGGTFLYFRAFLEGLGPELPAADTETRRRIAADAARLGWHALHERLATIDPAAAARIHPHDTVRIARALEIHALSGRAPSAHRPRGGGSGEGRVLAMAVTVNDRAAHRRRLEERLGVMLERGFLEEVRGLYARPDLGPDRPAIRAVGYRQLWEHCAGRAGYEEAVGRAVTATAQLAKRQATWIRSLRGWTVLAWEDDRLEDRLVRLVEGFLAGRPRGPEDGTGKGL